ncbi:MAG: serine/threonine protein kinase [Planctomycetes bacterium]|nr:serine/threonine protein kinase [Planctomycetota bacterium]
MAEPKRTDKASPGDKPPGAAGGSAKRTGDGSKGTTRPVPDQGECPPGTVDLTGRVLGDFCLLRKLGKGGMADVYLAEQTSLRRQVAIKIMRPDFVTDPQYVKRFRHEASAAGGLNHPNIVQVYMVGEQEGIHFISQEYVQGRNLKEFITRKGPLEVPIALHVLKQVAAALQVAHDKGIVHRDIKPENILLTKKGEAKVADFGLAQLTLGGEKVALTQVGITMGTPLYMSPEQVNGRPLDARSDIYSLGVMAWHMFAGHPPFSGETALAVAVKHLNEQPPSLMEVRPDIPVGVRLLVERMMSKKKEDRPADAQTVLTEIKQFMRQMTSKDSVPEAAFRPSRPSTTQFQTKFFERPVKRQLGWMAAICFLVAVSMAGVGWAMRISDPFKMPPAKKEPSSSITSIEGLFYHVLSYPSNEALWHEFKGRLDSATPAEGKQKELYDQMRDTCNLHLAMIYLRDGSLDRRDLALRIFKDFAASQNLWRQAHGYAGMAIIEDLLGEQGNREEVEKHGQHALKLIEQAPEGHQRLEPIVETALQDAMRRRR